MNLVADHNLDFRRAEQPLRLGIPAFARQNRATSRPPRRVPPAAQSRRAWERRRADLIRRGNGSRFRLSLGANRDSWRTRFRISQQTWYAASYNTLDFCAITLESQARIERWESAQGAR